jgi:hypothetical protein
MRLNLDNSVTCNECFYLPQPEVDPRGTKHHFHKMLDLFDCLASNESCPQFFEADNFIDFLEAIGLSQISIYIVSLKTEDNRSFLARKLKK